MRRRRLPLSLLRSFFVLRAKSAQRAQSCQQPVAVCTAVARKSTCEATRAQAPFLELCLFFPALLVPYMPLARGRPEAKKSLKRAQTKALAQAAQP